MKAIVLSIVAVMLLPVRAVEAAPIPIDLNDFFFYPGDPVTVAIDGSWAELREGDFSPVILSNDPTLGDPDVIIPAVNRRLIFDYSFDQPLGDGNKDEFGVFLFDAIHFDISDPDPFLFSFFQQETSSGTVSWDLSALVGMTLGLQFQLSALPGDQGLTSSLYIGNVRLEPIPEPSTLLLLGTGLLALTGYAHRRKRVA